MTKFINPYTKTEFLVADDRIDEYKAAGFMLAADSEKPKATVIEETKEEPKKTAKRVTKKK